MEARRGGRKGGGERRCRRRCRACAGRPPLLLCSSSHLAPPSLCSLACVLWRELHVVAAHGAQVTDGVDNRVDDLRQGEGERRTVSSEARRGGPARRTVCRLPAAAPSLAQRSRKQPLKQPLKACSSTRLVTRHAQLVLHVNLGCKGGGGTHARARECGPAPLPPCCSAARLPCYALPCPAARTGCQEEVHSRVARVLDLQGGG